MSLISNIKYLFSCNGYSKKQCLNNFTELNVHYMYTIIL